MGEMEAICTTCNMPYATPCDACNSAAYCSSECKAADSPLHTLLCSSLKSHSTAQPAPGPGHVRGALFPADSPTPSLAWVGSTKTTDPESGISFSSAATASFFGDRFPEALYTERNPVRRRDTQHMLEILYVEDVNLPENQAVTATAGRTFRTWRGPVLVLAMTRSTGAAVDPGTYTDVTLHDFRDVVDVLADHENPQRGRQVREDLERLASQARDVVSEDEDLQPPGAAPIEVHSEGGLKVRYGKSGHEEDQAGGMSPIEVHSEGGLKIRFGSAKQEDNKPEGSEASPTHGGVAELG